MNLSVGAMKDASPPNIAWHHAELVFEALGEIGWCREADGVGHFGNGLVSSEQELVAAVETGGAKQLHGRGTREVLHLAIELHSAEIHFCCDVLYTELAVMHTSLYYFAEAGDKRRGFSGFTDR